MLCGLVALYKLSNYHLDGVLVEVKPRILDKLFNGSSLLLSCIPCSRNVDAGRIELFIHLVLISFERFDPYKTKHSYNFIFAFMYKTA